MSKSKNPSVARPKRPPQVFVCAKCVRKTGEGRAIRKGLKAALVERAAASGRRPGKLVDTKCMGLCPKHAVTLASGATLLRGEVLMVRHADDVADAITTLLG